MGEEGEIDLKGSSGFTVDIDGTVRGVNGRAIDKMLITKPQEGTQLAKFSNGMYQIDLNPQVVPPVAGEPAAPEPVAAAVETVEMPNLRQGVLETSNISLQSEMAIMMEAQRSFQACSKALQAIDQINQKTVTIGGQ